ncbi:MAG: hypothetical protein K6G80_02775 [Treponema sp.]|nr:hypothetical protein [Treponema sp.]
MVNIVAQLENRFLAEFSNDDAKKLYEKIPEKFRQDVLIRKQNCKPYGRRSDVILWGAPDNKEFGYVAFCDISDSGTSVVVMPNPDVGSEEYSWYSLDNLKEVLVSVPAAVVKIVCQQTSDRSKYRLFLRDVPWALAENVLPMIIAWTRKHQNEVFSRQPQQKASIAASVGLKEFEMIALVLKTVGGTAHMDTICQKYAALFGFALTDTIRNGVKTALYQYTSDSDQFLGTKDLFKRVGDDEWTLR